MRDCVLSVKLKSAKYFKKACKSLCVTSKGLLTTINDSKYIFNLVISSL